MASSVLFSWYCQYRFTGPGRTVPCPPGPVLDFQWLVFEKVELETTIINDFEMTQKLSNMNSLVLGRDFCPLIWHGARFLVKFGHLNSLITVVTLRNFPPRQKFFIALAADVRGLGSVSLVSFKLFNNTWETSNPRFYPRPSRHCCAELFSGAHEFFSSSL